MVIYASLMETTALLWLLSTLKYSLILHHDFVWFDVFYMFLLLIHHKPS